MCLCHLIVFLLGYFSNFYYLLQFLSFLSVIFIFDYSLISIVVLVLVNKNNTGVPIDWPSCQGAFLPTARNAGRDSSIPTIGVCVYICVCL